MNIEYFITENSIYLDGCQFKTYGISAVDKLSKKKESDFDDVSLDKAFVTDLVSLLNSTEIELCHFNDVVIDELNK